jgi:hypothetical protein
VWTEGRASILGEAVLDPGKLSAHGDGALRCAGVKHLNS